MIWSAESAESAESPEYQKPKSEPAWTPRESPRRCPNVPAALQVILVIQVSHQLCEIGIYHGNTLKMDNLKSKTVTNHEICGVPCVSLLHKFMVGLSLVFFVRDSRFLHNFAGCLKHKEREHGWIVFGHPCNK
jgi:hypothetical protein